MNPFHDLCGIIRRQHRESKPIVGKTTPGWSTEWVQTATEETDNMKKNRNVGWNKRNGQRASRKTTGQIPTATSLVRRRQHGKIISGDFQNLTFKSPKLSPDPWTTKRWTTRHNYDSNVSASRGGKKLFCAELQKQLHTQKMLQIRVQPFHSKQLIARSNLHEKCAHGVWVCGGGAVKKQKERRNFDWSFYFVIHLVCSSVNFQCTRKRPLNSMQSFHIRVHVS